MSSPLTLAAASLALLGLGLASADGTRSSATVPGVQLLQNATAAGAAATCRIEVVRTGTPGTASVTRLAEGDGGCLCTVTTGPSQGNGQAEDIVAALLRDRSCDGAPAPGQNSTAFAPGPGMLPLLAVPVGAAGAAAASTGADSPG